MKNQTTQKAAVNRNAIMWGVLAAGLIFVAQAQAASVESILAEAYGFQLVPSDQWPSFGTYWNVLYGQLLVPYPGPPDDRNLRIFSLGDADGCRFWRMKIHRLRMV